MKFSGGGPPITQPSEEDYMMCGSMGAAKVIGITEDAETSIL